MFSQSPLIFLALPAIFHFTLAADCWGSTGVDPNDSKRFAWDLRDAVGGHNACYASDTELGSNHDCTISQPFAATGMVTIQRHDLSGNFANCYDALENIINQCFSDSAASFDPNSGPNGRWALGDEWYWISMIYNAPDLSSAEIQGSTSGLAGGTLMGPSQFCQGLAPGGGSCMQVPDGCLIDLPLDNTTPEIKCDLPLDG